jgi:hypothetical protein
MSDARPHTESELVELVRSIDVEAPEALHARVHTLIAEHARPGGRRRAAAGPLGGLAGGRLIFGGALALAAVIAAALIVGLSGGSTPTLSVREASALSRRSATIAAPGENPRDRAQLAAAVEGVAFPYWKGRFGWRSTGARSDHVAGRAVTTVFYADSGGQRIGYAIVAGKPAPRISGGVIAWRNATPYRIISDGARELVSWQRDGHLCVISGTHVSAATLLRLASWDDRTPQALT